MGIHNVAELGRLVEELYRAQIETIAMQLYADHCHRNGPNTTWAQAGRDARCSWRVVARKHLNEE